jgi:dUTP pyrophosphatase
MTEAIEVKVKYLHPMWQDKPLGYGTQYAAGLDLRACFDEEEAAIAPGEKRPFATGVAIEIVTPNVAGFVFSRSGLGTKQGLVVTQGVGVIDPDYRGEIIVSLHNIAKETRNVYPGQRIAQLLFMPAFQASLFPVQELSASGRGEGGFGHTG